MNQQTTPSETTRYRMRPASSDESRELFATRKRDFAARIAAACFTVLFVFIVLWGFYAVGYKNGQKTTRVEVRDPIYHLGPMPPETTVLAIYSNGGIITMESARLLDDGRILPANVHSELTYYDLMPEPIGWTEIPAALVEAME